MIQQSILTSRCLMRSCRLPRPVGRGIMLKWDLQVVLSELCKSPCAVNTESNDVIELKWRTVETVFIISLATARRRSLLHALSADTHHIVWGRGNVQGQKMVRLLPQPGFMAKNQFPTQAPQWISIPGIAHLNPNGPGAVTVPCQTVATVLKRHERTSETTEKAFSTLGPECDRYITGTHQSVDCHGCQTDLR